MRHKHRRSAANHTRPDLPITPMLDMSFQLLSFFVITYKPATLEGQLSLMLPKPGNDNPTPSNVELKIDEQAEEELAIRVQSNGNGGLLGLELGSKTSAEAKVYTDTDELQKELKKIVLSKNADKQPLPKIDYQFAGDLNYQFVIKQLDEAKQAGFEKVTPSLLSTVKPKKDGK